MESKSLRLAKLAAQVAKLYRAAADGLRNARLVADKAWPALLAAHISTFDAWTQLHAAAEHEEAYEYGAQVARLSQALVHMEEVGKGGRERSVSFLHSAGCSRNPAQMASVARP